MSQSNTVLIKGMRVMSSRGPGKFIGVLPDSNMAEVEIKTTKGTIVVNEFTRHLKPLEFDVGTKVERKWLHRGQKLEGKVTKIITLDVVEVVWEDAIQAVPVETHQLRVAGRTAEEKQVCLHV